MKARRSLLTALIVLGMSLAAPAAVLAAPVDTGSAGNGGRAPAQPSLYNGMKEIGTDIQPGSYIAEVGPAADFAELKKCSRGTSTCTSDRITSPTKVMIEPTWDFAYTQNLLLTRA